MTCSVSTDHFLLDTEPELREKVHQHIRRYIIADQVELEDVTGATAAMASKVRAPPPCWRAGRACARSRVRAPGVGRVHRGRRQPHRPARLPHLSARAGDAGIVGQLDAAGAQAATAEDARLVRIENGKPRYGEDIRDTSLPQETQQMHAVSFTKGCYLGQEIVERIRAQGHVNRKLVRLELACRTAGAGRARRRGAEAGESPRRFTRRWAGDGAGYVRAPIRRGRESRGR